MDAADAVKIFLSYARKDGSDLARRLHDDLKSRGFAPWLDKHRIAGGASWTDEIEQALDAAAFFLAVMTRGSYESEICRAEQLRALRKGKLVIPVLGQSDPDVVPLYLETKNHRDLAANYAAGFDELLEDLAKRRSLATLPDRYRQTPYNTVPALPMNYVERASELRALRDALITDGERRHIALTALRGMGGIGKSILAQALCHDSIVQQAFPDGIVWLTVGREPAADTLTRLREAAKALGDDLAHYENEMAARNRIRSILRDKATLIVLDDVWDVHAVEAFSADSPRSRLLITTRDASIAAGTGATEHIAGLLSEADARSVLAKWSGVAAEMQPPEAAALIEESGRLPLALAMIGAMVRGKPERYWSRVVTLLREADLEKIRAQFPDYPHHNLFRAMEVGVAALDEVIRARYLRLAAALEDMTIAPAVQRTLWGCDEGETMDTAEALIGLSLAERVGNDGAIRLHDLQLDYLRTIWPDRGALLLIHGALRLSMHVLAKAPTEFATQMVGRLLGFSDRPGVAKFVEEITAGASRPWFRPRHCCFDAPGGALLRTLSLDSRILALTPDGKTVVSASHDHKLEVRDIGTSQVLCVLEGHSHPVLSDSILSAAVTPDGKQVVSSSQFGVLRLWDVTTGLLLRTIEGVWAGSTAFTPDGRSVLATNWESVTVWDPDSSRRLRTLAGVPENPDGHSTEVSGVVVTPDGERAVTVSVDKTVKVWDFRTGQVLHTLEGHRSRVLGVAVTPDGKWAVSASGDQTLKVWDLETGRELRTFEGHSDWVNAVAVTPDGKQAVSVSHDKTLKIWDLNSGLLLRTLEGHADWVRRIAVTPDGKCAVSVSDEGIVNVWDLAYDGQLRPVAAHSDVVFSVAVTPDGKRAVSASKDETLRVWDTVTGRVLNTLRGHDARVFDVAATRDGARAISASLDYKLKVWDLDTGAVLQTMEGHTDGVNGVVVTPDGERAVSASTDKTLKLWNMSSGALLRTLEGHTDRVDGVAVTPDGKRAFSASADGTIKVWDLDTGSVLHTLDDRSGRLDVVAVIPDGERAVFASSGGALKLWESDSGRVLDTPDGYSCRMNGLAVTPDGTRAISAFWDATLKLWDIPTGRILNSLGRQSGRLWDGILTPDEKRSVEALSMRPDSRSDTRLEVRDLDANIILHTLEGHTAPVCGVAVSPDSKWAISASTDDTLKVWDLDKGRATGTLESHSFHVRGVVVASGGRQVVISASDGTLQVWDLDSGRVVEIPEGPSSRVNDVAVAPDGKWIVSACVDKTLKLWNLKSGMLCATFHCAGVATCCAFADNRQIVAGDEGGRFYSLALEV